MVARTRPHHTTPHHTTPHHRTPDTMTNTPNEEIPASATPRKFPGVKGRPGVIKAATSRILAKLDRMRSGESVVLSEYDLDILAILAPLVEVRTLPNPDRIGTLDKYVGTVSSLDDPQKDTTAHRTVG